MGMSRDQNIVMGMSRDQNIVMGKSRDQDSIMEVSRDQAMSRDSLTMANILRYVKDTRTVSCMGNEFL